MVVIFKRHMHFAISPDYLVHMNLLLLRVKAHEDI